MQSLDTLFSRANPKLSNQQLRKIEEIQTELAESQSTLTIDSALSDDPFNEMQKLKTSSDERGYELIRRLLNDRQWDEFTIVFEKRIEATRGPLADLLAGELGNRLKLSNKSLEK